MQCTSDVICAYGLKGNEEALYHWLDADPGRHLVVLQDKPRFSSLKHPRAKLYFLSQEKKEDVLKQIAWEYLFLRFSYWADPQDNPLAELLFEELKKIQEEVHLVASDVCDPDLRVVKNVLANVRHLARALPGKELFGAFTGIPAIICGSGPSLSKNGRELKGLEQKALLFGGGSALPLVADLGIEIHFSAAIDPEPPSDRFLAHTYFETPFFYKSRVDRRLLQHVQAPLLFLPDGSIFIGEEEAFDGGWNVATFCTALAIDLGCSPIIFVGLDLSADPSGKIYAPGITATAQEEVLIQAQDEEGKPFYSKRDWLAARSWLRECAKKNPEIFFVNATEGGIGIPGVLNLSLKEVKEKFLQEQWDLQGKVKAAVQAIHPNSTHEPFEKKALQLESSLKTIQKLCLRFLHRAQEIFPKPPIEDGVCALALFEIEEEDAYSLILKPFWEIWERLLLREEKGDSHLHKVLFLKKTLEGF